MLIRQAPEYLEENGYCQMMIEWVQVKGQALARKNRGDGFPALAATSGSDG